MPKKIYVVKLAKAQQQHLRALLRKGTAKARVITRAHILLLADEQRPDVEIAEALHIGRATVERTRKRSAEGGMAGALKERPRPGQKRKLGGKQEALLIALACSDPPDGRECWTMQLLADRLVARQVVDRLSDETVRRVLNKTNSSPGSTSNGASRG